MLACPPLLGIPSSSFRARPSPPMAAHFSSAAHSLLPPLPHRDVVLDLVATVDARLGPQLLPSAVPADVRSFASASGAAVGALDVRRGAPGSAVDFILESWLHCDLPAGALDITSLIAFLNASTDAPHFILDLVQASPSSIILVHDLVPRKDLALHVDYLRKYYEDTQLEQIRREIAGLPEARPYVAEALYIRSIQSPTNMVLSFNCDGASALEEIVRGKLADTVKAVLDIWIGSCARPGEAASGTMLERDAVVKEKLVELDLAPNLPVLFGADVGGRVLAEIRKAYQL